MFWGVELQPCQPVVIEPPVALHVTRAALAMYGIAGKTTEKVRNILQCSTEDSGTNFVLGSLREGAIEQLPLDLVFSAGKKVTFFISGPGAVHLSGYFVKDLNGAAIPASVSPVKEQPIGKPIERSPQKAKGSIPDPLGLDFVDDDDEDELENGRKMLGDIMEGDFPADDDEDEDDDFVPAGSDDDENDDVSMSDSVAAADREELRIIKHQQHQKERQEAKKKKEKEALETSDDRNPVVDVPQTPARQVDPANIKSALKKPKRPSQEELEAAKKKARVSFSNRVLEQQYDQETPINFDDDEGSEVVEDLDKKEKNKHRNPTIEARQQTPFTKSATSRVSQDEKKETATKKKEAAAKKKEETSASPKSPKSPNKVKMNNGLILEDEEIGNGQEVRPGDTVKVHYVGTLSNGKMFDQTKRKPFSFTLGAGDVIKGWDLGVKGMRVGGRRKLTIPPSLGYGRSAVGPIPGNSTLNFTIRLVGVGK